MSRIYTVIFDNVSVTAAGTDQDFFSIVPGDDQPCGIIGIHIGNASLVGDGSEDMIRWSIVRGIGEYTIHDVNATGVVAIPVITKVAAV